MSFGYGVAFFGWLLVIIGQLMEIFGWPNDTLGESMWKLGVLVIIFGISRLIHELDKRTARFK